MSGEFRAMIERFYRYANSSPYSKIYQEVLLDELDVLEEEPVHIISIPVEKYSHLPVSGRKDPPRRPPDHLYKHYDFSEVFLFAFLRMVLRDEDEVGINALHSRMTEKILDRYGDKLTE